MFRSLFKILSIISLLGLVVQNTIAIAPAGVTFKSSTVTLPDSAVVRRLNTAGSLTINLETCSPAVLNALSPDELKELLKYLGKQKVKIRWKDNHGVVRSGRPPSTLQKYMPIDFYDKSNAAAGLTLIMFTKTRDSNLIAKMIAAAPDEVLTGLKHDAHSILTPAIVSKTLLHMLQDVQTTAIPQHPGVDSAATVQSMGILISTYLKYWAKKDPQKIEHYIKNMVNISHITTLSPENAGVLCGAIIGGSIRMTTDILEGDVRRVVIALMIGNLIGIITNLIAIVGVVSPAAPYVVPAAILPAILGAIAILIPGIFALSKNSIRDYRGIAREVTGGIEMWLLQQINDQNRSAIYRMIAWMKTAVHINSCCY